MKEFSGNKYFDALNFATKAHSGQKRKGTKVDYISHPLRVALIVMSYRNILLKICPEVSIDDIIAACILHDVMEDCGVSYNELKNRFGVVVSDLVQSLTSNKNEIKIIGKKAYIENKIKKMKPLLIFLKLSDRIANVTDTPTAKYCFETKETMNNLIDYFSNSDIEFKEEILLIINDVIEQTDAALVNVIRISMEKSFH